jgi:hypothetical protein
MEIRIKLFLASWALQVHSFSFILSFFDSLFKGTTSINDFLSKVNYGFSSDSSESIARQAMRRWCQQQDIENCEELFLLPLFMGCIDCTKDDIGHWLPTLLILILLLEFRTWNCKSVLPLSIFQINNFIVVIDVLSNQQRCFRNTKQYFSW